ncbi:MAG TPA: PEGA domain-containing protein, partial [Thermoanaerobaculia bacterium]|nr:PEGA domain-containing protein [Thermoanaerobaculia bacterium]
YTSPAYGDDGGAPLAEGDSDTSRGHLLLLAEPSDASVFLNDQFVGTGADLSNLSRGLQVPPGQHTIKVSRPGMTTEERTVIVGPGRNAIVEISLRPS